MSINFSRITKVDIINESYSQLRISGITVKPTPGEIVRALNRLEMLADKTKVARYNYEDEPEINSLAGISLSDFYSLSVLLAVRLLSDYGKSITNELQMQARVASQDLATKALVIKPMAYPGRMPVGSGNSNRSLYNVDRFYDRIPEIPPGTRVMKEGDVDEFSISWADYLKEDETISSYTITPSKALTCANDSIDDEKVVFTVTAVTDQGYLSNVVIQITTSDGRVSTRTMTFYVEGVNDND